MTIIRRRPVFYNNNGLGVNQAASTPKPIVAEPIIRFHRELLGAERTPLIALDAVAKDLGLKRVFVKDETRRFGSAPHSTLGVSWAIFRSLTERLNLPLETDLHSLRDAVARQHMAIYLAAAGDFGIAVARAGAALHVPTNLYIAGAIQHDYIQRLQSEGAIV